MGNPDLALPILTGLRALSQDEVTKREAVHLSGELYFQKKEPARAIQAWLDEISLSSDEQAEEIRTNIAELINASFDTKVLERMREASSNRVWTLNNRDSRVTVEDDFRRVMHMGVRDSLRVPVDSTAKNGVNNQIRIWEQRKYPLQDSPIPVARYAEAQLIIAEVRRDTQAVRIINELHAAAGLPPFAAADADSILRHVIEGRRLELFLEGQHFYDKLRFNGLLDPDPLPDTPPPGSVYINGGTYGASVCLPLPDVERLNNPNIP